MLACLSVCISLPRFHESLPPTHSIRFIIVSPLFVCLSTDELGVLTAKINQLNIQRRQVLSEFLDLKGNIRVFCRVRPIRVEENYGCLRPVVALDSNNVLLRLHDNKSKSYSFDKVFHPGSSQDEVFSEIEPVVKSVLDGYNACIFAYGQTGTGKTFTMEGNPDSPGVVPRTIEALFKQVVESNHPFLISFSMLEIYLGNLQDLLTTQPTKATDPMPPRLSIKTDPKSGIEINNLAAIQVNDFNQALRLYRLGCRFRTTASTNSNTTSSRSHSMIRISITCFDAPERRRETNKIWLVDLGGSERVLKTKAWGRRLDEGKAINLSLSALGDVINALQRKKRHVPYSKLTRVLKDSLGEDSKTLMLVHVSPKEEDLCETICSLNFASRAKSIHLGHDDLIEIRDQKEASMKNLQQKMERIEEERLKVRGDIEKLSEELENLTRPAPSFEVKPQVPHLSSEEPLSNLKVKKDRIGDVTAPLSQLPGFMRSTFCSRRKSGRDLHTVEEKGQVLGRRRRRSSHRAESVTFPVKNISEYNSEHSISKSSCLAGLNMKSSADYETDYSIETVQGDINMVTFGKQEKSQRTSIRQRAPLSYPEQCGNQKKEKDNSTKFPTIGDCLLHKSEPLTISCTQRSKPVQAVPIAEEKCDGSGPNRTWISHNSKVPICEFKVEAFISHNTTKKQFDVEGVEVPVAEVITEKPQTMLKDLFAEESRSNSPSASHTTQTTILTQDFVDGLLLEDNASGTLSSPDMCSGRLDQYEDDDETYLIPTMQAVKFDMPCPDSIINYKECSFSPTGKENHIFDSKRDTGISISISELESHCQEVSTEIGIKDKEMEDFDDSSPLSSIGTTPRSFKWTSQRTLFMDQGHQKCQNMPYATLQGTAQSNGTFHVLKQRIQIVFASVLLGFGFLDLGLDHDFFHGLML
ncbi:kinesin-like protein KIN-14T isoform X1 [Pistacia vera]|uniref:kinesin-like protein KIN-14T isoform X1 n=1 Tax=Pistacia vera TaxID=55513 RepID=UPI001263073A|nr:kinesin-like protein KIN-14T isoform X1 [Pistacia vera]